MRPRSATVQPASQAATATATAPDPTRPSDRIPAQRADRRSAPVITESEPEPELEPWNPEATYESLVRLLAELKALHPDEVAVLPRRPSRLVLRRPRRPRRVVAGVAAAAVVVAGARHWWSLAITRRHTPPVAAAAPHMSTALIAIEANGALAGGNLLASDDKRAQEILLPSRLLVDVPGQGSTQLSTAPDSGPGAASAAVENALHVRIDGTWVLDPTALAALVNAEGGVDVTLTNDVVPDRRLDRPGHRGRHLAHRRHPSRPARPGHRLRRSPRPAGWPGSRS